MGPYEYLVEKIDGDYAFLRRTDIESDDRIAEIVRQLDSRTLAQHAAATSRGKKRVTVYTVPSAAFRVMQIASFVPYEYRPDADPVEI